MGHETRERLQRAAGLFRKAQILSFTVDRAAFASPSAALAFVHEKKLIARLMRFLGVSSWVRVIEFQEKSGDGWPHWHVLIDAADVRGGGLTKRHLKRVWALWRDKWGVGGWDAGVRRRDFKSRAHAVNYITKYLTKYPGRGFPPWLLELSRVRFWDASAAVRVAMRGDAAGAVDGDAAEAVAEDCDAEGSAVTVDGDAEACAEVVDRERPIIERVVDCGHVVHVIEESVNTVTGEIVSTFRGSAEVGRDSLLRLRDLGGVNLPLESTEDFALYVSGVPWERVLAEVQRAAVEVFQVEAGARPGRVSWRMEEWERNGRNAGASAASSQIASNYVGGCGEKGRERGRSAGSGAESASTVFHVVSTARA